MFPTFSYTFARFRGSSLGWGVSLALLGAYLMPFYDALAEQQEALQQLISSYPPELMAFFGDIGNVFTPEGYLSLEYFSFMPVILGIFAVLAGSGLLASDEENGTLDLLLAHPVSRTALFVGRLMAFLAAMGCILALAWLGLVAGTFWSTIDIAWSSLALPFWSLLGELLLFGALALFFSLVFPSRRLAAMLAGMALVASFFVTSLARISEDLKAVARFSPLNYYQSGEAILGLNGEWLAGLLAVALALTLAAWWRFERRDIRVAGEGSWGLPLPRRRPARAVEG